jgi:hypothetical protein
VGTVILSPTEILVLLSALIVAPAMVIVVDAALTGAIRKTENARSLPLRSPEPDWWSEERPAADRGKEGTS